MKIIQVTDLHLVTPGELLCGLNPLTRLQKCIDDINRHHADADMVIFTGDLSDTGTEDTYVALAAELERLAVPYHLMMGNHDDRDVFLKTFASIVPQDGFVQSALDTPEGKFILLDTLMTGKVEGRLDDARLTWLKHQLHIAQGQPVYVFTHHPPFPIHMPHLDPIGLIDADALFALLREHGNVRHIFAGHAHRPVAGSWRGIPVSVLRGTNHQSALGFDPHRVAITHEPPVYGVIFIDRETVIVHSHDFLDTTAAYY
ncbi:phosphodiesterase [Phyllobacterium sp. YR531]|uniref:phosphodiesterase n=1 Tax=Phyllobacterium sp. YR531 TaxID=1144343 RepID=UPI00026F49CC|nr:phosphodiesterase [Phyllobacterium sp. YR531]EJN02453.1 putative phosphohydrolase [Phyllobacterium sp. YR531]